MTARRLDGTQRTLIRLAVGACPTCSIYSAGFPGFGGDTVICRRSPRSLTMRCETCGLQWTMTLAKIHQAMKRHRTLLDDEPSGVDEHAAYVYEIVAAMTEPAAEREQRGRRTATSLPTDDRTP